MPAIQHEPTKIRGELLAFSTRADDGWGTGEILVGKRKSTPSDFTRGRALTVTQDEQDTIAITGKLLGARVGDMLELEGVFTEHHRFGRQFKIKTCTVTRPDSPDGAVRWMASRFPDVGEGRARAMVDQFGDQLWDVIEREAFRLAQVPGITLERALAISAAYREVAGERDNMIKLRGWGLTDNQVGRCIERWHSLDKVVRELQLNPYLLSQEVFGFGFLRADAIARNMGVKLDSPERVRAGVEHTVGEACLAGHCYIPGAALQREAAKLLQVDPGLVGPAIRNAAQSGRLVRRGWRVYAKRMDRAEERLARGLAKALGLNRKEHAA